MGRWGGAHACASPCVPMGCCQVEPGLGREAPRGQVAGRRAPVVLINECPLNARLETGVGLSFFLFFRCAGRRARVRARAARA